MKDGNGKIIKWFGTCTDIDDQKKASELLEKQVEERTEDLKVSNLALIQSAKMTALGEMAAGIAHEINNPLAIITENADLLKELIKSNPANFDALEAKVDKIETTALRIAKIVEGLRTFSREGSDVLPEDSSLKTIVESTLGFCRERFRLHSVKLSVAAIPEDLKIVCRPTEISQVILNLLNNAFQAIDGLTERWINIEFANDNEQIELSITDCGLGISPERQRKLFQPFFTTKPVGKGTGLGLSISKGIIESHHGKLFFDKTCSNTRFTIVLPKKFVELNTRPRESA